MNHQNNMDIDFDYYLEPNYVPRERSRVPNRAIRLQVRREERPTPSIFARCRTSLARMNVYKVIPYVVGGAGLMLLLLGLGYYVYHLVLFIKAFHSYPAQYDAVRAKEFWDFLFFMVAISVASEVLMVILSSGFCAVLFHAIFSFSKFEQLAEPTQKILKSTVILFSGIVVCYLQTVIGLYRYSILMKINNWLNKISHNCLDED